MEVDIRAPLAPADLDVAHVLARKAGLNLYDALYLHLAMSECARLASRDVDLLNAARGAGLTVHDLRATPGFQEPAAPTFFSPATRHADLDDPVRQG